MDIEPTIYVVDDDEAARKSVGALVSSMDLRAEIFESAEAFLAQFDPTRPGCLVTDVRMMGMSGMELQEKLAEDHVSLPVIVITAHAETPLTVKAVKRGAVTVLEKPCRDHELFDAIRDAIAQDARTRTQSCQAERFRQQLESLSPKERAVLDMMIDGTPNKAIARRLNVSIRTIENRRRRIFEKTRAGSLAELVGRVVEERSQVPPK